MSDDRPPPASGSPGARSAPGAVWAPGPAPGTATPGPAAVSASAPGPGAASAPGPAAGPTSAAWRAFERGDYAGTRALNAGPDRDPELARRLGIDPRALAVGLVSAAIIAALFAYYVIAH